MNKLCDEYYYIVELLQKTDSFSANNAAMKKNPSFEFEFQGISSVSTQSLGVFVEWRFFDIFRIIELNELKCNGEYAWSM